MALAGQCTRLGCFELETGKTLLFSPSGAGLAVLGWDKGSYLSRWFLPANSQLFSVTFNKGQTNRLQEQEAGLGRKEQVSDLPRCQLC